MSMDRREFLKRTGFGLAVFVLPSPLLGEPKAIAAAAPVDHRWHYVGEPGEPQFLNGWNGRARYRLREDGCTDIDAQVVGGKRARPAFEMPDGYRPQHDVRLHAFSSDGGYASIEIRGDGAVVPHP